MQSYFSNASKGAVTQGVVMLFMEPVSCISACFPFFLFYISLEYRMKRYYSTVDLILEMFLIHVKVPHHEIESCNILLHLIQIHVKLCSHAQWPYDGTKAVRKTV